MMNATIAIVDLNPGELIGKIRTEQNFSGFREFPSEIAAGFLRRFSIPWINTKRHRAFCRLGFRFWRGGRFLDPLRFLSIRLPKWDDNPNRQTHMFFWIEMMLELCVFSPVRSQAFPEGQGCEPHWQHIARCRELRMVRVMLPPPCRG